MVGKTNKLLLISSVALLLVQYSTSSPIQNELLEALTAQFDSFKVQFSLLERKNTENEAKIADHEAKIREQADEINQFKAKFDTKQDSAQNFLGSYNDENILPSDYTNKINSINDEKENAFIATSSTRAIAPASCRELALIGHSLDGLYLVKNPDTKKIETVLCNFGTSIAEELIGGVDVKTTSVHFYVQRNTAFNISNSVIPFQVARLNVGGAMNLASGVFTAPVDGTYYFEFVGQKDHDDNPLRIDFRLNSQRMNWAFTPDLPKWLTTSSANLLRLKAGDKVDLYNGAGVLYAEDQGYQSYFTGWLIDEDLK